MSKELDDLVAQRQALVAKIHKLGGKAKNPALAKQLEILDDEIKALRKKEEQEASGEADPLQGQTQMGLDYLGLGHKLWPISDTLSITPKGFAIGCFDTTFGDAVPAVRKLLASDKFPKLRVHIWYGTAKSLASMSLLQQRVPLYEKIAKDFPNVKVYVSHSVEYTDRSATNINARVALIKKLAPHCIPVNNPWTGYATPGVIKESHDTDDINYKGVKVTGNMITSTDGIAANQIDANLFRIKCQKAAICFMWGSRFNLRHASATPLPDPKLRTCIPTPEYIKAYVRLCYDEGAEPKPTFSAKFVKIKDPYLMKSFAEDYCSGDPRANKPLLISPSKAGTLKVVTKDGKEIGCFKFYGNFPPNLHRHYSGNCSNLWGYQFSEKAKKASDSEFVWLRDGAIAYGPVNLAFRRGSFRDD